MPGRKRSSTAEGSQPWRGTRHAFEPGFAAILKGALALAFFVRVVGFLASCWADHIEGDSRVDPERASSSGASSCVLRRSRSTQGGGSSGTVPVRDRQQHAAVLNERVAEVERELSIARDQALPGTSGALVAAIGPGLEESKVDEQLQDKATGTDVVTVREGRAVVHVESDTFALRTKIGAYARENTPKGKPRFQELVARLDTIEPATIEDLSLGEIGQSIPDDERLWVEISMPGGPHLSDDQREIMDAAVREFAALSQMPPIRPSPPFVSVYRGMSGTIISSRRQERR